jgi:hypothetical protein
MGWLDGWAPLFDLVRRENGAEEEEEKWGEVARIVSLRKNSG